MCIRDSIKGVIFDLGYSLTQIKDPKKGLSFNSMTDLNMQLGLNNYSAADAINKLDAKELEKIFKYFGDEKDAKYISKKWKLKHLDSGILYRRIAYGLIEKNIDLIGEKYVDKDGNHHLPMSRQPVFVLSGAANVLRKARNRANERGIATVAYIEEMFSTGHDEANRAVFAEHMANEDNTVGIALRADKKTVDKIAKGAKMHS